MVVELEMKTENIDRRVESANKLNTLLGSRTNTLVLYSQLAGFRPFDARQELRELLQEFCESLVDYTASAHFQLYRYIAEGIERRKSVKELADKIYPHITNITQNILDFNDKYEKVTEQEDFATLDDDLSHLGEVLADRIGHEDRIISVMTTN
jgi:regulator of sigma D